MVTATCIVLGRVFFYSEDVLVYTKHLLDLFIIVSSSFIMLKKLHHFEVAAEMRVSHIYQCFDNNY